MTSPYNWGGLIGHQLQPTYQTTPAFDFQLPAGLDVNSPDGKIWLQQASPNTDFSQVRFETNPDSGVVSAIVPAQQTITSMFDPATGYAYKVNGYDPQGNPTIEIRTDNGGYGASQSFTVGKDPSGNFAITNTLGGENSTDNTLAKDFGTFALIAGAAFGGGALLAGAGAGGAAGAAAAEGAGAAGAGEAAGAAGAGLATDATGATVAAGAAGEGYGAAGAAGTWGAGSAGAGGLTAGQVVQGAGRANTLAGLIQSLTKGGSNVADTSGTGLAGAGITGVAQLLSYLSNSNLSDAQRNNIIASLMKPTSTNTQLSSTSFDPTTGQTTVTPNAQVANNIAAAEQGGGSGISQAAYRIAQDPQTLAQADYNKYLAYTRPIRAQDQDAVVASQIGGGVIGNSGGGRGNPALTAFATAADNSDYSNWTAAQQNAQATTSNLISQANGILGIAQSQNAAANGQIGSTQQASSTIAGNQATVAQGENQAASTQNNANQSGLNNAATDLTKLVSGTNWGSLFGGGSGSTTTTGANGQTVDTATGWTSGSDLPAGGATQVSGGNPVDDIPSDFWG